MMLRLIPKVFYDTLEEGLDLFVNCLGFEVRYRDEDLAVVERDGAKAYIVASPEYAAKDRPEIAIETDNIHALYDDVRLVTEGPLFTAARWRAIVRLNLRR